MPELAIGLERAASRQNWLILCGAAALGAAMLWTASHAAHPLVALAAAVVFGFLGNTLFALLHEAVHGHFDHRPRANAVAGHLTAAMFPTAFTLQTALHLTHHRNNRSPIERFDYIGPDESIPLKTAQWFTILTGLYWLSIPLFWAVFVIVSPLVPWRRLVRPGSRFADQTSAGPFLESALALPLFRIRAELALTLALQAALFVALDLSFGGWLLCYAAFGLAWSSLQYADHAFSPIDRIEGSWNLTVSRLTRAMFLHYHSHLTHHRDPDRRWQAPPPQSDCAELPFLAVLLAMWKGPRLLPGSGQGEARQRLLERCVLAAHIVVFGAAFQLVYGLCSLDFAARGAAIDVALPIDRLVPFEPAWAFAYVTIMPLLLTAALVLRAPPHTTPFLGALLFQIAVAGLCFVAWPVAPPQPPAVAMSPAVAWAFALADGINLQGNCLPSLHVALALSSAWACHPHLRWPARLAVWGWALAIVASTALTWQHWLVDLVAGAALAAIAMGVVYPALARALAAAEDRISRAAASR